MLTHQVLAWAGFAGNRAVRVGFFMALLQVHLLSLTAQAEVVRLVPTETKEDADRPTELSGDQLRELQSGKLFVVNFVAKWDGNKRWQVTSANYKRGRNVDWLKRAFNKETYLKVDFVRIDLTEEKTAKHLTIKAHLYWASEGYDGIQTFYFVLVKERRDWLLEGLIY